MIVFKSVTYKNFLSTGNTPTTFYLDQVPSVLITGTNGAGKSTMLDALCFGIYGKPYRNINKPQLVNTVNEKNLEVEIVLMVNEVEYKVIRGIKPNKFEIYRNGNLIESDAAAKDYQKRLEDILGLNYKAFTQIVILGSARYQSFMELNSIDRRAVIEEILDITVFSKMNTVLKTRIQDNDLDIQETNYQKEILQTKISGQKGLINSLISRTKETEEKIEQQKNKAISEKLLLLETVTSIDSDINLITVKDVESIRGNLNEAKSKVSQIVQDSKKIDEKILFYKETETCHTCEQSINDTIKETHINKLTAQKSKYEAMAPVIQQTLTHLETELASGRAAEDEIRNLQVRRTDTLNEVKTLDKVIESLVPTTQESDEENINEAKEKLVELDKEHKAIVKYVNELQEKKHYLEICKVLLKDGGIKSKIIKQYLPVMNQLINQFLDRMGANYSFTLDESFSEVIKSRYRDQFSYASFSEGEKMRIDLALVFTWREIAKIKNSINTNLLIMDEVGDSSLDGEATDILWEILSEFDNTNVFVISHKQSNVDKFNRHLMFTKEGNFSKMVFEK